MLLDAEYRHVTKLRHTASWTMQIDSDSGMGGHAVLQAFAQRQERAYVLPKTSSFLSVLSVYEFEICLFGLSLPMLATTKALKVYEHFLSEVCIIFLIKTKRTAQHPTNCSLPQLPVQKCKQPHWPYSKLLHFGMILSILPIRQTPSRGSVLGGVDFVTAFCAPLAKKLKLALYIYKGETSMG